MSARRGAQSQVWGRRFCGAILRRGLTAARPATRVLWIGALRERAPLGVAVTASLVGFAIHWPYFGLGGVVFITMRALLPIGL
jgi:hypothetical protein